MTVPTQIAQVIFKHFGHNQFRLSDIDIGRYIDHLESRDESEANSQFFLLLLMVNTQRSENGNS